MLLRSRLAALVASLSHIVLTLASSQPNVVFILTDDQDAQLGSMDYMPFVKKHIASQGTTFSRHYCTVSLCCPSRVSIWTGKAAHNHNVTSVDDPYGGYNKFVSQGLNDNYLPVWLQEAGYATYYVGKLFNYQNVANYRSPFANGWTGSEFLLDPFTYNYMNPWLVRNKGLPKSYSGQYSTDVVGQKALGFLDDAAKAADKKPFFLAIAPVGPHAQVDVKVEIKNKTILSSQLNDTLLDYIKSVASNAGINSTFSPPVPAARHANLFPKVQVPRTPNFNPSTPSGVDWVAQLPQLSADNISYNDEWYRDRLRALQSVDELVDQVITKLDSYGLLDNTYVFYSADNGYHISQHRMGPGKGCPYEADLNVPLVVRGPGIARGAIVEAPTAHIDLSPTFLDIMGIKARPDFDGAPIPLRKGDTSEKTREHVQMEFWSSSNQFEYNIPSTVNNTYKSVRLISHNYDLAYTVWCSGAHELYDMRTDQDQMHNLYSSSPHTRLLGVSITELTNRLDGLLFVMKTCTGSVCQEPWAALLPDKDVTNLASALNTKYDKFFADLPRVSYSSCQEYYLLSAEGPIFTPGSQSTSRGLRF